MFCILHFILYIVYHIIYIFSVYLFLLFLLFWFIVRGKVAKGFCSADIYNPSLTHTFLYSFIRSPPTQQTRLFIGGTNSWSILYWLAFYFLFFFIFFLFPLFDSFSPFSSSSLLFLSSQSATTRLACGHEHKKYRNCRCWRWLAQMGKAPVLRYHL